MNRLEDQEDQELIMGEILSDKPLRNHDHLLVGHSEGYEYKHPRNTFDDRGTIVIKGTWQGKDGMPYDTQEAAKASFEPKTAMRFDSDKLRFDLIPPEFLIELARVYSMGALKYDDDNWRKGMPWRKVYRPIWSHFIKWLSGHTIDSETGCHHLAMVAWNCATLFMYQLNKLGKDDRNKFAIDESFNYVDNHLQIGLAKEKIEELKVKYTKEREKHK